MAFDQRVKGYFTDLKADFWWIRILILYISNISILPLDPQPPHNHISKISISLRPPTHSLRAYIILAHSLIIIL